MNHTLAACFLALSQAFAQCAANAASVMPVWQNDTVSDTLSFQDTFGHQVNIGTYNPATGAWLPGSISVGQTFTGGLISVSGSPVTGTGTLALTIAGTSGGIPFFASGTTWASSGTLTANQLVLGGGPGSAPSTPVGLGTTTQVLHGNAAGPPSFGTISTADAAGILAWTQSTGSGVATTLNAKLQGAQLYPDDYGTIDRTGATDMGPLINTAITAAKTCGASSAGGNDVVRLRAGTYLITTPIVPKSCVTIQGDGRGKTILLTNSNAPFVQTSGTQLVHFNMSGITFKDSGTHAGATALSFTAIQGSRLSNLGFHGYTTGTMMSIQSGGTLVSSFDDSTGTWNSSNSFFNTFDDFVDDDQLAYGIVLAGWLTTPCNTATATTLATLNTFKDISLWGITAVGWDLVRGADTNQFIGNNIIRLVGSGAAVITPHASFKNIAVQFGDDNATCAANNDIAMERMMLTISMGSPATSFVMFNAGNNTFGHSIDFQADQATSVNAGITAMAGVTGVQYAINGRNYLPTFDDGAGNLSELELSVNKYYRWDSGTAAKPIGGFVNDLPNGYYLPAAGIFAFSKSIRADVHLLGGAAAPGTPTTCGTSPPVPTGSDTSFTVTTGSSATTACTIPFGVAFSSTPKCTATPVGAANSGLFVQAASQFGVILNYTSATSAQFNVQCIGLNGG